ncbi:MAG: hypothetical protein ACE5GO_09305, partial [Anaerolineales bacterium]
MPDCRYYQVGGLTIQVESYLPITDTTFHARFEPFEVDGPGEDNLLIRHHFTPFDFQNHDLGRRVYRQTPWSIYRKGDRWIYLSVSPTMDDTQAGDVGVLSVDHTQAEMYHAREDTFRRGDLHSLSMFTTDQIILSHVFADRQAVIIHSGAVIMNGQGLLFAGHSEAGKSTTMTLLKDAGTGAEILCDDRNIVRKWDNVQDLPGFGNLTSLHGWRVHGTWSHGDIPDVSPASAPLRAALFLEQ